MLYKHQLVSTELLELILLCVIIRSEEILTKNNVVASPPRKSILRLSKGIEHKGKNARQCFQALKGKAEKFAFPMPEQCEQHAPEDINAYADGSLTNSKVPDFGLLAEMPRGSYGS